MPARRNENLGPVGKWIGAGLAARGEQVRQQFASVEQLFQKLFERVFFAFHKLDVISSNSITRPSQMAPYLNLLVSNTFGNYRNILDQIKDEIRTMAHG